VGRPTLPALFTLPTPSRRAALTALGAMPWLTVGTLSHASASPFPRTQEAGNTALRLNGFGTRYRFTFKVYDMALYTPRKVGSAAELLALSGPKRLEFIARRDLSGTELGRLFLKGMADNVSADQMNRHTPATTRLIQVFSGKPRLMPGDDFSMAFEPGKGTTFYIEGKPQGTPVGNDEFFTMILRIWFGDSPVDRLLRDALLDRARAPSDPTLATD
jgi:hypothetical protein